MGTLEGNKPQERVSLRDSVLKRPRNRSTIYEPQEGVQWEDNAPFRSLPGRDFFGGMRNFFGDRDDDAFPSFGFGNMDRFEQHINDMMSRFFSDFQPESFADSQYYHEDRDLDEDIGKKGLDQALKTVPESHSPRSYSGGFSYYQSTVTRPDGSTERRVTQKDSDGNVTNTITVTHPDGTSEDLTDLEQKFGDYEKDLRLIPPNKDRGGLFGKILDNFSRFF